MRPTLNRIHHYLTKQIPSLQQKEDAPERKTIRGSKLRDICQLICGLHAPLDDQRLGGKLKNFLDKNPSAHNLTSFWEEINEKNPNSVDDLIEYIEKMGFDENNIEIKRSSSKKQHKNSPARSIHIKNLEIQGDFRTDFIKLSSVKFSNNLFHGEVEIKFIGTPAMSSEFHGNIFKQNFMYDIFNIRSVTFKRNKMCSATELCLNLPSLEDISDTDLVLVKAKIRNLNFEQSFIKFSENEINSLIINDNHNLLWCPDKINPFDPIRFAGGNRISILIISTTHTNVSTALDLKTDVNKIFFDRSDNIDTLENKIHPTPLIAEHEDWKIEQYHILYRRFFALLKQQAAEQHSRVFEDIYTEKVRYFDKKFASRWEDKIIFMWGDLVSNGGTSWKKPLIWLVSFQFTLSFAAWSLGFSDFFWVSFFEFLNPLSGLSSLNNKEISAWVSLLHLCHKLVAAVTIYEIIKALRRFHLK